jgi:predicted dienelactone hydrolase
MNSPASAPGPFAVCTHTFEARDHSRDRLFPCDIWCPDEPGAWPLVLYSHHSRGNRRSATYLTSHLASHGYLVAALDHSEVVAPESAGSIQSFIDNRVPDARFLLDYMLTDAIPCTARPDPDRVAIVGHSAGGWTAWRCPKSTRASGRWSRSHPAERPVRNRELSLHSQLQLAAPAGHPLHRC